MSDYFEFVQELVAEGKTTGPNQSEDMVGYTKMSLQRMKRWNKVGVLLPEIEQKLSEITSPQNWTLITEAWCGDAAHAFMFIKKMADSNAHINFDWKLRDENLELMDQYLTNGGRSIPKLIAFDAEGNELFNWGPRPKHIQETYLKLRETGVPYSEISIELQKLYNADKGVSMQKELLELM
ncbi:MAG: thioredoxin family protein [Crocinitomicaceae bacterium]